MDSAQLARTVAALLGDASDEMLDAAGASDWPSLLREHGVQTDDPIEALAALRDAWDAADEIELAVSATTFLVHGMRERWGEADPRTLLEAGRAGALLIDAGDEEQGAALIERSWEAVVDVAQPGEPHRAGLAALQGQLRVAQERASEAIFPLREAARVLADIDPETAAECAYQLGRAMIGFGNEEEGFRLVEQAVRQARTTGGPELVERLAVWAPMKSRRVSVRVAEAAFREWIDAATLIFGPSSAEAGRAQAALAGLLLHEPRRGEEAIGMLDVAVSLLVGSAGPEDPSTRKAAGELFEHLLQLARGAIARRDWTLARTSLDRAEGVVGAVFGPGDARLSRLRELGEKMPAGR